MSYVSRIMASHPRHVASEQAPDLATVIEACYQCHQACLACADACLGESMPGEVARCIRLNLDCADVSLAAGSVLIRPTVQHRVADALLRACIAACEFAEEECARHAATHPHCEVCRQACEACREACGRARASFSGTA